MPTDKQGSFPPTAPSGPSPMPQRVVIVGASVRALAESAARAGLAVSAADLFGDRDLLAVADGFQRAVPYPAALPDLTASFPTGPCLITGALENHPGILTAIAARRPLAGASVPAIESVRDPVRLRELVARAGLRFPETRFTPAGLPLDDSWLLKPLASAGGHGIRPWRGWCADDQPADRWQWQQRVSGQPWSASFLIDITGARLIGVCRQLIGRTWTAAKPFHWSGGIDLAPEALPVRLVRQLERLGRELATVPGLVGLVGVDVVVAASEGPQIIEVNPRATASMELVERSTGLSLAVALLVATGFWQAPVAEPRRRSDVWSKAILFAAQPVSFDERTADRVDRLAAPWTDQDGWPALADLPLPPQTIPAGRPICTVFARGRSAPLALRTLIRRTRQLARC